MSLRAAILGFLDLDETSGYLLRKRFEDSVGSFWSVTQSQIYRELHALEADGLVASRIEEGEGKPNSKIYGLTKDGRAALAEWLSEPVEPVQLRHPMMLKFVFASELPQKELDAMLTHYAEALKQQRETYAARLVARQIFDLARSKREGKMWRLAVEHGLAWCDAELAWIAKARAALKREAT
jgi:PadR family transcriptional regulator AphA